MFSFGVLLCELITGKTSRREVQHYPTYKLIKRRNLLDDADEFVDWESNDSLKLLIKLAMECLEYEAHSRPSIGNIVKQLQKKITGHDITHGDDIHGEKCRICGESSDKMVRCYGTEQHIHCDNCVEKHLIRNANKLKYEGLFCLKDGCDSREFDDSEIEKAVSSNFWKLYTLQRSSTDVFQNMVAAFEKNVDARFLRTQQLQMTLCAGNGLPCPRLFILLEANRNVKLWNHPKEW